MATLAVLASFGAMAQTSTTTTDPRATAPPPGATPAEAPATSGTGGAVPESGGRISFSDVLSVFRLGAWSGNVGLYYSGEREQVTQPNQTLDLTFRRAWEQITLRNDEFYWLDPGVFSGNVGITYGFNQNWQTLALQQSGLDSESNQSQHGTVSGYDVRLDFLRALPYNGTLYANRAESYTTQPFGGSNNTVLETEGVILRWGEDSLLRYAFPNTLPYFSATLEAYQRKLDQTTLSYGGVYRQDEVMDVANLDIRNGFETADLAIFFGYVNNSDLTYSTNSYISDEGRINYSLDFGRGLNHNWTSLLDYYDRRGAISLQTATVDERLLITHATDFTTMYRYVYYQQDSQSSNQTSQNFTFNLRNVLWRNLTTNVEAQGTSFQSTTGTAERAYGDLRFDYNRSLPGNGRIDAVLGGRYEYDATNIASGQIQVYDEPHVAPPVLGVDTGFPLRHTLVISSSIVVVDVRGGARLATTLNVDYSINVVGDQTRIIVLPTSPVIQPGDPLAVSYAYSVGQDAKLNAYSYQAGIGVSYDWFGLRYRHYELNETPLTEGAVPFIDNVREDDWEANLNGSWQNLRAGLVGLYKNYNSTRLVYTSSTLRLLADYRPSPDLWFAFNGQRYKTDYSLPVQTDISTSARLDLNWYPTDALLANAYAYRGRLTSTSLSDDTATLLGLKFTYNWRKITLVTQLQSSRERRNGIDTDDLQFSLSLTRRL